MAKTEKVYGAFLDGVILEWMRPSKGYRVVVPSADDLAIWKADEKKSEDIEIKQRNARIRSRGRADYEPTEAEQSFLDRKGLRYGGLLRTPFQKPTKRLVPVGTPEYFRLTTKGAEKALREFLAVGTFDYLKFSDRYGSLRNCPIITNWRDNYDLKLSTWQNGEIIGDIDKTRDGLRAAATHASANKKAFMGDFSFSNVGHYRLRFSNFAGSKLIVPRFEPDTLLGMLWYVLACGAVEGIKLRPCNQCNQLMVILPGSRSDKDFCSARCKMRSSRASTP